VTVEECRVAPGHLVTVTGVDAHRIVADAAAKPETPNCGTGQAHVDAQLPAQVDGRFGLFVPGVAARRRRAVPLLQDQPDVDVFLQAADPQLLAVGADQRADRRQRTSWCVRVDGRVVDPEHSPFRSYRDDQL
jgi:RES domain-containing protein